MSCWSAAATDEAVRAGLPLDSHWPVLEPIPTLRPVAARALLLRAFRGARHAEDLVGNLGVGAGNGTLDRVYLVPGHVLCLQQAFDVGGLDRHVAALRFGRGAGIARRDQHLGHARRLRQLPRQRVFAAAGTDDEEFHVSA